MIIASNYQQTLCLFINTEPFCYSVLNFEIMQLAYKYKFQK